jgi:protein SCO1/2
MRWIVRALKWLACAAAVAACSGGKSAPDFTLRDDRGNASTLSAQQGKAVLLTFGFTHCRDTCPATLARLSRLSGSPHDGSDRVQIAFVTIDPARDGVAVLHRFVERLQPTGGAIVGLTGSPQEIARVKTAYHVWSHPSTKFIPSGVEGLRVTRDYDIAHTAVIFFIDPRGRLAGVQNDDESDATLSRSLAALLTS